jgi:hypothetical protein
MILQCVRAVMQARLHVWSAETGLSGQFHAHMPLRALHEFRWTDRRGWSQILKH